MKLFLKLTLTVLLDDITSDNQAVADEAYGWGYGDGAASVDITSDNQAVADEAYADGAASVGYGDAANNYNADNQAVDDLRMGLR